MKVEKERYYNLTVYFITLSGIKYNYLVSIKTSKKSFTITFEGKELKHGIL